MSFLLGWNLISFRFHHPEEVVYRICFFLFQGRRSNDIFMTKDFQYSIFISYLYCLHRVSAYCDKVYMVTWLLSTWIGTSMQAGELVPKWKLCGVNSTRFMGTPGWIHFGLSAVTGSIVVSQIMRWFSKKPYKVALLWDLGNGHPSANSTTDDHGALIPDYCEVLRRLAKYIQYVCYILYLYIIRSPILTLDRWIDRFARSRSMASYFKFRAHAWNIPNLKTRMTTLSQHSLILMWYDLLLVLYCFMTKSD